MDQRSLSGVAVIFGMLMAAAPAAAQFPIPPAQIQATVQTLGGYKQGNTYGPLVSDYQKLGPQDVLEHAEATLLNIGVPALFADAEASGPDSSATADVNFEYFFHATGPQNIEVPVVIQVNGLSTKVERSGGGTSTIAAAESRLWVTNDDYNQNTDSFSAFYDALQADQYGMPFTSSSNFVVQTKLYTRANEDRVSITMDAHASVWTGVNFSGKATAMLDPLIYVDPSFPDASLYSIVLSPAVQNSPVPELPARWQMLVGLLLLLTGPAAFRRTAMGEP